MSLDKELADELGRRLVKTDLDLVGNFDDVSEKRVLRELLKNQCVIMQVLAAMNGMSPNPKAYKDLLD